MKKDGFLSNFFTTVLHIGIIAVAVILIYQYAEKSYLFGYRIFKEPPVASGEGRTVEVTVGKDATAKSLATLFESKGLIRDKTLFIFQYYCSEYRKDLRSGTYELSTSMTVEEMFAVMAGAEAKQ